MSTGQGIEFIMNNLRDGFEKLKPRTFCEAFAVQNLRRARLYELRRMSVYTATTPFYKLEGGILWYGMGGANIFEKLIVAENTDGNDSPVRNIREFTRQIFKHGAHKLTEAQKALLKENANDIAWARADDMGLVRENNYNSYLSINTSDFHAEKLSGTQKPFAIRVFGSLQAKHDPNQEGPDYEMNMRMLRETEYKIQHTGIRFPTQTHIRRYLNEGDIIVRASKLDRLSLCDSDFNADSTDITEQCALCGIPTNN